MKHNKLYMTILLAIALSAFFAGYYCSQPAWRYVEVPMSVSDTQRYLQAENLYQGKIDGIWGPATERAWCDYMAVKVWPKGE